MDGHPRAHPLVANPQRWFIACLLVLFVAVSVQYTFKIAGSDSASAFLRWREQILSLDGSDTLYDRFSYPNPPIMALMLRPIVALPPLAGALSWFYLKVAMTLLALAWSFRLIETPEQPFPAWAKALAVVLSIRPIMGDLMHGNVNLLILFLVVAALYAFRNGRDLACGLLLGLAIACKVTPALFVPYFLWKRQWKVVAACAVGLVLFLGPIPGFFLGQERNLELLQDWAEQMLKPFLVSGKVFYSEHNNQSLPGLIVRMLTHSPSFSTYLNGRDYTPLQYHNVLSLDTALVPWIVKGCMVLFACLGVWACRTPTSPRAGWRLPAEFGLVLLGMLLFSERTWKHHCVTLLLPFCVIVYFLATCRPGTWLRNYLLGTLAATALLMLSTSTGPHGDFGKLAQVYGAYVWAYLLLAAALVVLLRQPGLEHTMSQETT